MVAALLFHVLFDLPSLYFKNIIGMGAHFVVNVLGGHGSLYFLLPSFHSPFLIHTVKTNNIMEGEWLI